MRYENKVGLFSRSLKFLYSIGIVVYSFNDSVLWHLNKGVHSCRPPLDSVLKGNVVFSALSQLLDLDYPSKREATGQG